MLVLSNIPPLSGFAPIVTAKTLVVTFVRMLSGVPLTITVLPIPKLFPLRVTRQGLGRGPLRPMLKVAITNLGRNAPGKPRLKWLSSDCRLELAIITGINLVLPTPRNNL